jgi:hypothetical protein
MTVEAVVSTALLRGSAADTAAATESNESAEKSLPAFA